MSAVSVHVYGHLDTEDADHCAPLRGRGQLCPGRIKRDGGQRGVVSGDHQLGLTYGVISLHIILKSCFVLAWRLNASKSWTSPVVVDPG